MRNENETVPFILNVPVLDDETVDALQTFLWDLVTQFESQYFHQLQRYHRKLDAMDRDPLKPWLRLTPSSDEPHRRPLDEDDLNDEIPF